MFCAKKGPAKNGEVTRRTLYVWRNPVLFVGYRRKATNLGRPHYQTTHVRTCLLSCPYSSLLEASSPSQLPPSPKCSRATATTRRPLASGSSALVFPTFLPFIAEYVVYSMLVIRHYCKYIVVFSGGWRSPMDGSHLKRQAVVQLA